jgi:hypothetical protein
MTHGGGSERQGVLQLLSRQSTGTDACSDGLLLLATEPSAMAVQAASKRS